jgi:Uma2 family endonuclease
MIQNPTVLPTPPIIYPESDGLPMADNTRQLRWIVILYGNLAALFRNCGDVFVGANQFWYPVEGQAELRIAPDVYVVFGRPKGDRSSYQQWQEADVPLTVVFEILSPGNTVKEMYEKQLFYEDHGVDEYYVFDPDSQWLMIFVRQGSVLRRVRPVQHFVSPRLGIRFDLSGAEMIVYRPDGHRFVSFQELEASRVEAEQRAIYGKEWAARLAQLSRKARHGQATPDELKELERLEDESATPKAGEGQ